MIEPITHNIDNRYTIHMPGSEMPNIFFLFYINTLQIVQFSLREVVHAIPADHLVRRIDVVGAQDEYRLLVDGEAVHIFDADARLREALDRLGELTDGGIHRNGQHRVQVGAHTILLQQLEGFDLVGGDETQDAIVGSVRHCSGDHTDVLLAQKRENLVQPTELILQEN